MLSPVLRSLFASSRILSSHSSSLIANAQTRLSGLCVPRYQRSRVLARNRIHRRCQSCCRRRCGSRLSMRFGQSSRQRASGRLLEIESPASGSSASRGRNPAGHVPSSGRPDLGVSEYRYGRRALRKSLASRDDGCELPCAGGSTTGPPAPRQMGIRSSWLSRSPRSFRQR